MSAWCPAPSNHPRVPNPTSEPVVAHRRAGGIYLHHTDQVRPAQPPCGVEVGAAHNSVCCDGGVLVRLPSLETGAPAMIASPPTIPCCRHAPGMSCPIPQQQEPRRHQGPARRRRADWHQRACQLRRRAPPSPLDPLAWLPVPGAEARRWRPRATAAGR
jgi:hypothetical protein